ncbi:MAG: polysaccharide biosynthesis/export family protein [Phycisphaerales bacterium]|nr:MAG: polysaccharide biosynthesis/export family protein [Phycisphaerales bacterium]
MAFAKRNCGIVGERPSKSASCFFLSIFVALHLVGCSDQVSLPSQEELAAFEKAGPVIPTVSMERLMTARMQESPLPGEVLEITMPVILQVVTTDEPSAAATAAPFLCRVSETGTIALPAVGEIEVAGKTLAQIEAAIIGAYYPEYTQTRPSVFVRLAAEEEVGQPMFTVLGLVSSPGNFPYPPRVRYNMMQALGFAGGLDRTVDPRYATIYRLGPGGTILGETFAIANVKKAATLIDAMNTPIKPGDVVFVEHTPRTRTKEFLDGVLRITVGAYLPIDSAWDED